MTNKAYRSNIRSSLVRRIFLILVMAELAAGCGPESRARYQLASNSQAVVGDNGLGDNGLGDNGLGDNGLGDNGLGDNGLGDNGLGDNGLGDEAFAGYLNWFQCLDATGLPDSNPNCDPAARLAVFRYAIKCALRRDQHFVFSIPAGNGGVSYDLSGWWGLAPGWRVEGPTTHGEFMSTAEKELVSACVMASVNVLAVHIPVSMRGPNGALSASSLEVGGFRYQEAGFFGNIFATPNRKYVCTGQTDGDPIEPQPSPPGRVCSWGACTSLTFVGPCYPLPEEFHSVRSGYCEGGWQGGYFTACSDPEGSPVYRNVITTYLARPLVGDVFSIP